MEQLRPPTHPGAIIKHDYLEPLNISIASLAEQLGIPRVTVANIVNEHISVTDEIALCLARVFNTTPELWIGLQRTYDLWYAEQNYRKWFGTKRLINTNTE